MAGVGPGVSFYFPQAVIIIIFSFTHITQSSSLTFLTLVRNAWQAKRKVTTSAGLFKAGLTGADLGFCLGGGALVSCSSSTPINHTVFFCRIQDVLENRRSSQGGGFAHPLYPPPRSAPGADQNTCNIFWFLIELGQWSTRVLQPCGKHQTEAILPFILSLRLN